MPEMEMPGPGSLRRPRSAASRTGLAAAILALIMLAAPAMAIFTISVTSTPISFGTVALGSTYELPLLTGPATMIKVVSSTGPWTVQISSDGLDTPGGTHFPDSGWLWRLLSVSGSGTPIGLGTYTQFTPAPSSFYISAGRDETGRPVTLALRFRLVVPENQISGSYSGKITITLAPNI